MSYYRNEYPDINDTVIVRIESFSEHGIYCRLIEYGDKEGLLLYSELDKKVYKDRHNYFNFKNKYPMTVINIDYEKGLIDLSHKKMKSDDIDLHLKNFHSASQIYRLTEEFSELTGIGLEELLPLTMWEIMKKDDLHSSHKKLKSILQKPDNFVNNAKKIFPSQSGDYLDSLSSRISSTTVIIHQNFDLIVYSNDAINEIKKLLNFPGMDSNVKIEYINSPTYRFIVECKFDDERNELIDNYVESHKQNIKDKNNSHNDHAKLGSDVCIEEINRCVNILKEKIKDKNIHFELGDKYLFKEREVNIRYLPKKELMMKRNNSSMDSSKDFYEEESCDTDYSTPKS
jgi:translation initiation factor 2 subunit 1